MTWWQRTRDSRAKGGGSAFLLVWTWHIGRYLVAWNWAWTGGRTLLLNGGALLKLRSKMRWSTSFCTFSRKERLWKHLVGGWWDAWRRETETLMQSQGNGEAVINTQRQTTTEEIKTQDRERAVPTLLLSNIQNQATHNLRNCYCKCWEVREGRCWFLEDWWKDESLWLFECESFSYPTIV